MVAVKFLISFSSPLRAIQLQARNWSAMHRITSKRFQISPKLEPFPHLRHRYEVGGVLFKRKRPE